MKDKNCKAIESMYQIKIEDKGQDFTTFIVCNDVIIDCQPFQGEFWIGKNIHVEDDDIYVTDRGEDEEFYLLNYNIEKILEPSSSYKSGFSDGVNGEACVDTPRLEYDEQYKFGVNVARYNGSKGYLHNVMDWDIDE